MSGWSASRKKLPTEPRGPPFVRVGGLSGVGSLLIPLMYDGERSIERSGIKGPCEQTGENWACERCSQPWTGALLCYPQTGAPAKRWAEVRQTLPEIHDRESEPGLDGKALCSPGKDGPPLSSRVTQTTLCEVIQRGEDFGCKRIRLKATVLTDCYHGAALIDDGCARGIALWRIQSADEDPSIPEFYRVVCGPPINGVLARNQKVTAMFTGRFLYQPHLRQGSRALEVETVENVVIKHLPGN